MDAYKAKICVFYGVCFVCWFVWKVISFSVIDMKNLSGKDLAAGKVYHADEFYVIDSYASTKKGSRYFLGMITDRDGIRWFFSFDAPQRTDAYKLAAEKLNGDGHPLKLSGYCKIGKLRSEAEKSPDIMKFYREVCRKHYDNFWASSLEINATYICSSDENVRFYIFAPLLIAVIILGIAPALVGLKYLLSNRE